MIVNTYNITIPYPVPQRRYPLQYYLDNPSRSSVAFEELASPNLSPPRTPPGSPPPQQQRKYRKQKERKRDRRISRAGSSRINPKEEKKEKKLKKEKKEKKEKKSNIKTVHLVEKKEEKKKFSIKTVYVEMRSPSPELDLNREESPPPFDIDFDKEDLSVIHGVDEISKEEFTKK